MIDFYNGAPQSLPTPSGAVQAPVSIYLDVRPALDSVEAVVDRLKMSSKELVGSSAARSSGAGQPGSKSNS